VRVSGGTERKESDKNPRVILSFHKGSVQLGIVREHLTSHSQLSSNQAGIKGQVCIPARRRQGERRADEIPV
jgi:hypothetical protein